MLDIVSEKTPNTNSDNTPNYSLLKKNLENIKSEFMTLRAVSYTHLTLPTNREV